MELGKMMVRKKNSGYQYIIPIKKNVTWSQISKQGFVTAREARIAGNAMIRELIEDGPKEVTGLTFGEVAKMVENDGRKSSETTRVYKCWSMVYEAIADKPINEITYQDISEIIFEYQKKTKFSTVSHVKKHGSRIMRFAIRKLRIIKDNPFDQLDLIAPKRSDKTLKRALTPSEITSLINALSGSEQLITAFMALCGLRISEARGLTRGSIKNGSVTVSQQRTWKELKKELKTERSYRTVRIPKSLLKLYETYPIPMADDALLFPDLIRSGTLISRYAKAGYSITPHELRHSYTTNCISAGIDYKTVAQLIGDSVEMVYKVYSHVNQDMMDRANSIIENF